MEFQVQHVYGNRSPEEVWDALFDQGRLARAIPGCLGLEAVEEGVYRARLGMEIGPIQGTFEGSVSLSEAEPPRRYRLRLEGEGPPGQVRADAWIDLERQGPHTALLCRATVRATGTLAAVGERLMGGVGKMLAARFFKNIEEGLAEGRAAG